MNMGSEYLFCSRGLLINYLQARLREIEEEIYRFPEDYILNVSEDDLIKVLTGKYMLEPPVLKLDEKYQLPPGEKDAYGGLGRRVKCTLITVVIPFEGDKSLFDYTPSQNYLEFPCGKINASELILEYEVYNPEELKRRFTEDIQLIQRYLNFVKSDVDNFNNSLENYIRGLIKKRKEKILKNRELANSLEIPIRKRPDDPWTYSIPVKPKKINVELPKVQSEEFKPEPTLAMDIYEEILRILENMILTMERSPKTFSRLKEEELRDFFLVILNASFEGEAMGEVFNYMGRTDILIRYKNSNVFIAECKFWRGEKAFLETIDQLFRYVTWRDTKLAILIFNRDGNLKTILEKIPQLVERHQLYKRTIKIDGETKFRYVFRLPNDPNREVILTVMVFDIPKEKMD
jgi:hypothetical protein